MEQVQYVSKPMVYTPVIRQAELLCHGVYKKYNFYIYNRCGFPTAYVRVPRNHPLYGKEYMDFGDQRLTVHGGVTYTAFYLDNNPRGWYIGWDYAHLGDYRSCPIPGLNTPGRQYTTEEIIKDCEKAIDELKAMKK